MRASWLNPLVCGAGHYGGGPGEESSSSGGELEAGELVIDDSYTHLSKKKKKSKKSKKKKDKEKERDKEKSGKERKHSKSFGGGFRWVCSLGSHQDLWCTCIFWEPRQPRR